MPDVTLVLDADLAQYIAKVAKAEQATAKIGKVAAGIGDEFTKSIAKIEIFKKAIDAAGRSIDAIVSKGTEASKRVGNQSVSLASNLLSLGIKDVNGAAKSVRGNSGNATIDERQSFVAALAAQSEGQRAPTSPEEAQKLIDAFSKGGTLAFGEGGKELLKGAERGLGADDIVKQSLARRPGLFGLTTDVNGPVATEIGLRRFEDINQQEADRNRAAAGFQARAGASELDRRASRSAFGDSVLALAPGGVASGLDLGVGGNQIGDVRDEIANQTKELQRMAAPRPTLATTPAGGP